MQTDLLIFSGQSNMQGQTGAFPEIMSRSRVHPSIG